MFTVFRRRHARNAVLVSSALSLLLATLAPTAAAAATVGSDQADAARLQQQIAAQGAQVQALVSRFNSVQARVYALDAQIAHDQRVVDDDLRIEADATRALRRVAIRAYVTGGGVMPNSLSLFGGASSIQATFEHNEYLGAVGDKFSAALSALRLDEARTQDAQHGLQAEQTDAKKTLAQLTSAHDAANAAIAKDEAQLTRVNGDIRTLLIQQNQRRAAEAAAAERALAARAPAAPSAPSSSVPERSISTVNENPTVPPPTSGPPPPPTPLPPPTPGSYANPLRSISGLTPERIDQGVDYAGFGPIYAIGDGVVVNTVGNGWPGGTFIAYRLTDGPANGLVVFVAEDVEPSVQVGARVGPDTVLGHMYAGPDGIETGWADGSRLPDTMARTYHQFNGSNSTAFGVNFSEFLGSLGAPGGIASSAPSGSVPGSWPHW